jgi:two-component system NtrC family response regulator
MHPFKVDFFNIVREGPIRKIPCKFGKLTMNGYHILIIDPDKEFLSDAQKAVTEMGHKVSCAMMLADGLKIATQKEPDLIIINALMADGGSLEVLTEFLDLPSSPEVIVISDPGNPDEAELAIRSGAWDYLEKPRTARDMSLSVLHALEYRAKKSHSGRRLGLQRETFHVVTGSSARIKACLDVVALASKSDASVLITGETGTGKELFARAIHNNSLRSKNQFVVVDCASLPPTLVESTLFGYEKGAFTGADRPNRGLIRQADRGTLFLDEVGELPLSIQKSFLRVLQERSFRPVGGQQEVQSDFRLIAATNRNLDQMADNLQFRKDLLFRLRAFGVDLPRLCERLEDIPQIAEQHMKRLCQLYKVKEKDFSPDFFFALACYGWPGNVRELVNALDRAVSAAHEEPTLFPSHLPTYIRVQVARARACQEAGSNHLPAPKIEPKSAFPPIREIRDAAISEAEQKYLKDLIVSVEGDLGEARRLSGLSRSRLYGLLNKYGIKANSIKQE